jgi:hypothetical protein
MMYCHHLARKLAGTNVTSHAVNPGTVVPDPNSADNWQVTTLAPKLFLNASCLVSLFAHKQVPPELVTSASDPVADAAARGLIPCLEDCAHQGCKVASAQCSAR